MLATRRFARVDAVLREARGKQFTGAVARITHGGRAVFERAYGTTRDDVAAEPVYVDTRFDLASITKLFTATLALRTVAAGALSLDEPLARWFPQWKQSDRGPITLRMLLAHDSGMNSGADYRQLLGFNVIRYTLERELAAPPGEQVIYSDLGFIALGELLERATGRALPALLQTDMPEVRARFRPAGIARAAIPATEDDGWRGRVQGFVHDEKAYLLGGIAGHAGLFGSAADVSALAEYYLGPLCGRAALLPLELVEEATREQAFDPVLRRGLGWALKTSDENSCGRLLSSATFGHTGFVGTCVWADPERDACGVLLTNSVYFGRKDTRDLRAAFYEGMVEDLGLQ
ncbi:MAG: beta-lactamase family protein [Candidatus Eremiobacteraeota bacterium]|nr:beta-lactamase family protein [Candidatus Eremiobacteraeota bacterium]